MAIAPLTAWRTAARDRSAEIAAVRPDRSARSTKAPVAPVAPEGVLVPGGLLAGQQVLRQTQHSLEEVEAFVGRQVPAAGRLASGPVLVAGYAGEVLLGRDLAR